MAGRNVFRRPVLFALLLFTILVSSRILQSPDLGWHLRAGQRIVEERAIPDTDIFSSTRSGHQWWVNQPLSEILFYAVYRYAGAPFLILLRCMIIIAIFAVTFRSGRLGKGRSETVTGGVLLVAILAASSHMLVRPFLISGLCLAITGFIVERYRRKREGSLWTLPILFAVWAHIHPGFLYGAALLGAYCAGEWIRTRFRFLRGDIEPLRDKYYRKLLLCSSTAVVAALLSGALLNPSGAAAVLLPIGLMKSGYFFTVLNEFQPAHWWRDRFFTLLFLLVALSFLPRKRRDATEILLLLIFGIFAMRAVRVILPFAVVTAPALIRNLSPLGDRFFSDATWRGRILRTAGTAGILLLTVWWWRNDPYRVRLPGETPVGIDEWVWARVNYPVSTCRFIEKADLPGEIFHPDRYGGCILLCCYPERKNYVDGRVEVYGEEFWKKEYYHVLGGGRGWERVLERYNVNTLLLRIGSSTGMDGINMAATASGEWALVHFDDNAMVYVRRSAVAPKRLEELELVAVDPIRGPLPRSYEEEWLALEGITRSFSGFGYTQRSLFFLLRVFEIREEWEMIVGHAGDGFLKRKGKSTIRSALYNIRGEARFRLGDRERAKEDWKRAEKTSYAKRNLEMLRYLEEGRVDRLAAGLMNRSEELIRISALLLDAQEYERAVELCREAVRLDGKWSRSHNSLAWALLEGNLNLDEALREAREAVRLAPNDGNVHGTLGRALLVNGDVAGAERELRRAIELIPPDQYESAASERANLAILLAAKGEESATEEAVALAVEAISLDYETEQNGELMLLLIEAGREKLLDPVMIDVERIRRQADQLLNGVVAFTSCTVMANAYYQLLLEKTGLPYEEWRHLAHEFRDRYRSFRSSND